MSARIELLTLIYLISSHVPTSGFTQSSLRSSLTVPTLLPDSGSRHFNRRLINRNDRKRLTYSTIESDISYVNDTVSKSTDNIITEIPTIENEEIINESIDNVISIPDITEATSEQRALSILNDIDVDDFVSDILPTSTLDSAIEETLQSREIIQPIVDDITIVEADDEMLQILSEAEDMTNTSPENNVILPESTPSLEVPSVKSISKFAIAALGVWLCSPILSLIDTSAVGLLSGTAQQAALNPAVSVTEYTALLIAFMYTGTTNLIASAQERDSGEENNDKTADAFKASLQLSTFVGTILASGMLFSASTLLKLIIGRSNNLDPVVFDAALKYVKIRALGMPAAAITGSAQAACLGMKDTKSPLLILVMAASINLLGDILLVGNSNAWIGGAAGAAWATVFSQYAALFMFIKWLTVNKKNPSSTKSASTITKGLLAGKMSKRSLLQFPPLKIAKKFWPYFLPVTTTSAGRVSAYVAMAHVISSAIGTAAMAAQQIILSFFFCLTPVADSLSLTAQSFVPAFMERINKLKGNALDNANALRSLSLNIMKSALFFILGSLSVVSSIPLTSRFFTSDSTVLAQVRSITPYVFSWFSFHALSMSAEGILLGRKDLSFLGKAYGIYFFIIPIIYLRIKQASLAGIKAATLSSVWQVFIMYGLSRLFIWNGRLIQQTLHTMRDARRKHEEESVFG